MKIAPVIVSALAAASLCLPTTAQSFNYPDFSSSASLALNGTAATAAAALQLTTAVNQTASAWHGTPISVDEGFETEFRFSITGTGAEGMAFVIQNSAAGATALGGSLWGLGYGFGQNGAGIENGIAIEIDTEPQGFLTDTAPLELSVHTQGTLGNSENEGASIARRTIASLPSGSIATMRVTYIPGALTIYLNDLVTPFLTVAYTFETGAMLLAGGDIGGLDLPNGTGYVGFTAATGTSVTQTMRVHSWNWTSFFTRDDCYLGNIGVGQGGPYDVLRINGSTGGFFRTESVQTADPFTIDVDAPPGMTAAPFLLFGTFGIADGSAAVMLPFGTLCFGGNSPIELGAGPAPVQFQVPPGLPLIAELTLQGVMGVDPMNPSAFGITNAIALTIAPGPAPTITSVTPLAALPGSTVVIVGDNFSDFATVTMNGMPIPTLTIGATQITFAAPGGLPCDSVLEVRNPDGATASSAFNPTPVITQVTNPSGPAAGGQLMIVRATGYATGTTATFNGQPATVTTATALIVLVVVPPGVPGPATVVLTAPGGCSDSTTYTYL